MHCGTVVVESSLDDDPWIPSLAFSCETLTNDQVSTSQSPQLENKCCSSSAYLIDCFNQHIVEVQEVLTAVPGPSQGFG